MFCEMCKGVLFWHVGGVLVAQWRDEGTTVLTCRLYVVWETSEPFTSGLWGVDFLGTMMPESIIPHSKIGVSIHAFLELP